MKPINVRTKVEASIVIVLMLIVVFSSSSAVIRFGTDPDTGIKWGIFNVIRNSEDNVWEATGANIQVAIDDLGSDGGKVWLPEGDFTTTAAISLPSNTELIGTSMYTTRVIQTTDATYVVKSEGADGARKKNITVMDMTLKMDTSGSTHSALWLKKTDGFLVKNVNLENAEYDSLLTENSTDGMIVNCVANVSGDDGFNIYSNSQRISIMDCIATGITNDGIHVSGIATGTTIMGCISYNNGRGLGAIGAGEITATGNFFLDNDNDGAYLYGANTSDIVLSGNYFEGNDQYGIYLLSTGVHYPVNITIADNIIKGSDHTTGIMVSGAGVSNVSITGNTISSPSDTGVTVTCSGSIINDNTITATGGISILVTGQATVSDNYISDSGSHSIQTSTADRVVVSNNEIWNAGLTSGSGRGIYIYVVEMILCEGNLIYNADDDGISLVSSSQCVINDNMITDCKYGIWVTGDNNTVSGNVIQDPDYEGINVNGNFNSITSNIVRDCRYGINITAEQCHNIVANNIITDCNPAIQENANCDHNMIINNEVFGQANKITIVGSNTLYTGNMGYLTTLSLTNITDTQPGFAWYNAGSDRIELLESGTPSAGVWKHFDADN